MRLLLLLVVGALGTVIAMWGLPRGGRKERVAVAAGVIALLVITADAFILRPARLTDTGQPITGLFDAHLVTTDYLRLVVGLWGLESLVLVFMAWLLGGLSRLRGILPATLAAITGGTVAMASADLGVGAGAAAVTGLAALIVILAVEGPAAVAAAARELRVTLVAGAILLAVVGVVPIAARLALIAAGVGSDAATDAATSVAGPVMGLIAVALGLAVAGRWGMLPFHVRVSRLTDLVPPETLPLLLAWIAVPLTVVAFAAVDRLIAPLALPLAGERTVLVLLAVVTLAGASLAAWLHDDIRRVTGYLVVADSGLLLLAIAAMDPAAWGPGRAWVVVLAASKSALAAWAAVTEDRFETRSVPDLRGWARRSPLLAGALAITALATFGLPGWVAFESRTALATLVADEPWSGLLLVAGFLTLPTYLRLLAVGAGRVTSRVDRTAPERMGRRRRKDESLPVELEGSEIGAEATQGATTRQETVPGASVTTEAAPAAATGTGARAGAERAALAGQRLVDALRRNRTELLSGAVLALAILGALTSWGALGIADAAAEPAPIILGPGSD
jgi:formate hydrogenlyase subunit 3/multisubunit Na+/H+ antiporter MnhD subunit